MHKGPLLLFSLCRVIPIRELREEGRDQFGPLEAQSKFSGSLVLRSTFHLSHFQDILAQFSLFDLHLAAAK